MTAARAIDADAGLASALDFIAGDAQSAIDDLARMIGVDTSFPPGAGYGAFADLVEELVGPLGYECSRVLVPETLWRSPDGTARGDRTNLVARCRTGRPVCGLYFHVDTVPADPDWTLPPFALTHEGDRLYGLGAADMKG